MRWLCRARSPKVQANFLRSARALIRPPGITTSALEAPVRFLAADALEGRGPATRGDQLARLYLSSELEGLGYQPAFPNGQWQQPLDIVGIRADMPRTWSFQAPQGRWLIAQADAMPTWNPGDEFEAARTNALAAASR